MRIIDFNSTKCRHCYKCVRNCEIKAISVLGGRAEIMEDRCILCGRCLAVCPQEAKTMTSELAAVKAMIRRGEKVAAQLAPAYLGLLAFREIGQVRTALRRLGFAEVFETSEGAAAVTDAYLKLIEEGKMDNIITTCCPAANDLIEMYHPALVSSLAPVVSPMIAAGRIIRQKLGGDTRVVFIGPCIAKRKEAEDPRHADAVDAVISFHELNGWLQDENIRIAECESDPFPFDPAVNRIYPVTGGVLSSMSASLGEKAKNGYRQVCVHGLRNCIEFCRDMEAGSMHHCVVEMNVCEHGCIKGPAITDKEAYPFKIRLDMEERVLPEPAAAEALRRSTDGVSLHKEFRDRSIHELRPSEEEIRAVLAKTGKHSPADELNCGACGYASCREKAAAVLQGKAELEMCIPYLTAQAESMANLILKESPNAVIIVDGAQRILEYSDIGERFFGVSREQALNSFLWELIDPKDCETVYRTHQNVYGKRVYYEQYDLWTLQNIVYIPKRDSTLITFIDVTTMEKRMQQERERRDAAIEMAQNVIREQMFTAQKIAGLLGETTAETKMTLTKLMNAMQMGEGPDGAGEKAEADEALPPEGEAFLSPEEAGDLPFVPPPAERPKLKINTKYARPARPALADSSAEDTAGRQRGGADGS